MLRTAKLCAPRTRKPQLYGKILRDLLELFACSSPVACGAFSSETSLFLFTEAVVTLAGFFFLCLFFSLTSLCAVPTIWTPGTGWRYSSWHLFACTLATSRIQISSQKRHKRFTLTSVKTWRLDIVNCCRAVLRHQRQSRLHHPFSSPDNNSRLASLADFFPSIPPAPPIRSLLPG